MAGHTGPYEVLTKYLATLRKNRSITQQELANRLAKPQSFVSKYESGERKLDVIEFLRILNALGVDQFEAFEGLLRALKYLNSPRIDNNKNIGESPKGQ